MGGGGWGGGGGCEEDQNSSISLHVSEMFKLLVAFTPEMPITLSFLDSVLYEIQNKETKREREREREREKKRKSTFLERGRERERRKSTLLVTSYPIKGYFPLTGL